MATFKGKCREIIPYMEHLSILDVVSVIEIVQLLGLEKNRLTWTVWVQKKWHYGIHDGETFWDEILLMEEILNNHLGCD